MASSRTLSSWLKRVAGQLPDGGGVVVEGEVAFAAIETVLPAFAFGLLRRVLGFVRWCGFDTFAPGEERHLAVGMNAAAPVGQVIDDDGGWAPVQRPLHRPAAVEEEDVGRAIKRRV